MRWRRDDRQQPDDRPDLPAEDWLSQFRPVRPEALTSADRDARPSGQPPQQPPQRQLPRAQPAGAQPPQLRPQQPPPQQPRPPQPQPRPGAGGSEWAAEQPEPGRAARRPRRGRPDDNRYGPEPNNRYGPEPGDRYGPEPDGRYGPQQGDGGSWARLAARSSDIAPDHHERVVDHRVHPAAPGRREAEFRAPSLLGPAGREPDVATGRDRGPARPPDSPRPGSRRLDSDGPDGRHRDAWANPLDDAARQRAVADRSRNASDDRPDHGGRTGATGVVPGPERRHQAQGELDSGAEQADDYRLDGPGQPARRGDYRTDARTMARVRDALRPERPGFEPRRDDRPATALERDGFRPDRTGADIGPDAYVDDGRGAASDRHGFRLRTREPGAGASQLGPGSLRRQRVRAWLQPARSATRALRRQPARSAAQASRGRPARSAARASPGRPARSAARAAGGKLAAPFRGGARASRRPRRSAVGRPRPCRGSWGRKWPRSRSSEPGRAGVASVGRPR